MPYIWLVLLLISPLSFANKLPDVPMFLTPVSEHCFYVEGGVGMASDNAGFISNAGVIITDTQVIVIDALGTPALAEKLVQLIRTKTDKPITKVIVTHYHAEHVYGLQVFKALGAEIIAAEGVQAYVRSPEARARLKERRFTLAPWVNDNTLLISPDRLIQQATVLEVDAIQLELSPHASNHSEADLSIKVSPDGVLFAGDLVFSGRLPFIAQGNISRWLALLERLQHEPFKVLIPGHGSASTDPAGHVQFTYAYLQFLYQRMAKAVKAFQPFDSAYQQTNWQAFMRLPTFDAVNRRNAYEVYLALEARAIE